MDDVARELMALYGSGPGRSFQTRIELERPATYPEENLVQGRRSEQSLLESWIGAPEGLRILDVGCGRGRWATELAAAGARVTGIDLVPVFTPDARAAVRRGELTLVAGDARDLGHAGECPGFDLAVLREVAQDYEPRETDGLVRALTRLGVSRLLWTLRQETRWSWVVRDLYPEGLAGTVEFHRLLRTVHLAGPFRLSRRREVRRRNFSSLVVEMTRFDTRQT